MSFFFIRLMLSTKNTGVTTAIHARLRSKDVPSFPNINALLKSTVCVRGRTALAKICMNSGRLVKGKKVPLSRNMGVMKRKPG